MLTLLPNELWDFGPLDFVRGLKAAALSPRSKAPRALAIPGLGTCLPVRTARVAIVLALKALRLAPGARVGVPLYCCPVVFKAIRAAGCTPRFLDIDPKTYCLCGNDLDAKGSDLDAVIAVHMFGNVSEVPRLRAAVPGVPFIEDCAQSLGSRLEGRPTGAFSDVAALSFHSGKYISAGEGGALYSSRTDLQARLLELVQQLPVPTRADEVVHVTNTFIRSSLRSRPFWGLFGARLWQEYSRRVNYTSQSPLVLQQVYEADRTATVRRLASLDAWIARQRAHSEYYLEHLAVAPDMLCHELPGAFCNRLQFPLLFPTEEQRDQMAARLRKDGISTASPYSGIAAVAAEHYGYTGDCPEAERVARTVLVIPCNHRLSSAQVERVASSVNHAWSEIRSEYP